MGPARPQPSQLLITLSVVAISVVWGSTFLAYKISFESFPPLTLAALRFVVGGGILFLWGLSRIKPEEWPGSHHWRSALFAGAALFLVGNGAVVWSQTRLSSGVGGLVVATIPIWTALFARFVMKETIGTTSAVAIVAGFLGLVVLAIDTGNPTSGNSLIALGVATGGVIAWSVGSFYTKGPAMPRDPILAAGMQMLSGGVLLSAAAIAFGEASRFRLADLTLSAVLGLFYLAVPNALTFGTFVWLLRVARPVIVSVYAYIAPVVAVTLGWAFLSEPVTASIILGALLVVVSVFVLVTPPHWALQRLSALSPAPVFRRIRNIESKTVGRRSS